STRCRFERYPSTFGRRRKSSAWTSKRFVFDFVSVTGSGKSTLAQFLKENTNLKSIKSRGSFIIEGDKSIVGGIKSKTVFPELIVVDDVFYDCPRFEDTKGVDKDVSSTYFIKKVVNYAEKLKIILNIDKFSFFHGRGTFTKSLKHTSSFIRNVDKFLVDALKKLGKNYITIDKKLCEDTKKIVDALLMRKDGNYIRIGFFKMPEQAGKIFEIDSFKEDREKLLSILKDKERVSELGNDLQRYFENYIQQSNDILKLKKELEKINITTFKEAIGRLEGPKKFVQAIDVKLDEFHINLYEWNRKKNEILKYGSYLEFLQDIKSFLEEIHKKLSEYEIQIEREKYIKDWDCGTQIDKSNFDKFLEQINSLLPSKYECKVNDLKLDELNQLLKITLTSSIRTENKDGNLIIKGDYIILSKIKDKFANIKHVKIFCLNTLFIYVDLSGENFQKVNLTCISPRWNIVGESIIRLNRKNGLLHSPSKAKNGRDGGTNIELLHGKDGELGLPGGTAGSFSKIGRKFFNRNGLKIYAYGRKRGRGQDGGDGGRGQDGKDFKIQEISGVIKMIPPNETLSPPHPNRYLLLNDQFIGPRGPEAVLYMIQCSLKFMENMVLEEEMEAMVVKVEREVQGTIYLVNTSDLNEASDLTSNENEEDGKNGIGSKSGKNGNGEKVKYELSLFLTKDAKWIREGDLPDNRRANSGKNGEDRVNEKDIKLPEKRTEEYEFAIDTNEYKTYLRSNLNNRVKQGFLLQFHQELNNHPTIRIVYNTLAVFGELRN
ncbi:10344_t:CDS:2, partial [Cetraspora pellucida]